MAKDKFQAFEDATQDITNDISEKDEALKDFILDCAKEHMFSMANDSTNDYSYHNYLELRDDKYLKKIEYSKQEIIKIQNTPNEDLTKETLEGLENSIKNYQVKIRIEKESILKLASFKDNVHNWEPPTWEHVSFKDYVLQKIEAFIDRSCRSIGQFEGVIKNIQEEINSFDVDVFRLELISGQEKYISDKQKTFERLKASNRSLDTWLEELVQSMNQSIFNSNK